MNNLAVQALVAAYAANKTIVDASSARAAVMGRNGMAQFMSTARNYLAVSTRLV